MKTLFRIILSLFIVAWSIEVKAQAYQPESLYNPTGTTHPAYMTAMSFNTTGGTDFNRGFCFAWDACSPLANGMAATTNIWYTQTIDFTTLTNGTWNYTMVLTTLQISLPTTTDWTQSASNLRDFGDSLYQDALTRGGDLVEAQKAKNFWYGYACLLDQATMNPMILVINQGTEM